MKHQTIHRIKLIATAIILLAIALLFFSSCNKSDPEPEYSANEYIYEAFNEWYLWYDEIPELDPNDFDDYQSLIDAISVEQDRWSFAGSYTEIMKLFESGEYKGFGGGFIIDFDQQLKITHVYNNSPMGRNGVERGWVVESINNYTIDDLDKINEALSSDDPVDFVFTDHNMQNQSFTIQKESFQMNTVLHSEVFDYETNKIGYLVFDSFVEISEDELKEAFTNFNAQNITDLIVDLRYNGGGLNDIADLLIGMIGGDKVAGQMISEMVHNDKKSENDNVTVSDYDGVSLSIDKVYFLTTSGTASASELVINNLEPFMEVKLVGSNTHGKPVGMYVLSVEEIDLAILPISFKMTNSDGFGEYYNGLPVDINEYDDLAYNWGNPEEAMLKAAINDIVNPLATIASKLKSAKAKQQKLFEYKGFNQLINAY